MKLKLLFILILLAGLVMVSPVAAKPVEKGANHLYLYEKNPSDWTIVDNGAWGKMMYKDDMYVFNGHGLAPDEEYALINYVDPWGGNDNPVLGTCYANRGGNVHIAGEMGKLDVANGFDGSKIWLVPTGDLTINGGIATFTAWNPATYLFEANLI